VAVKLSIFWVPEPESESKLFVLFLWTFGKWESNFNIAFITKPDPDPESENKLFVLFSDTMVCTGCCSTLDHIVTYLFKQVTMKGKKLNK